MCGSQLYRQYDQLCGAGQEAEITAPTAKQWLKVLAAAGLVYLLEPFMHPNLKYGVKAPKVYFTDTGLAAYLLRWSNAEILEAGAMSSSFWKPGR